MNARRVLVALCTVTASLSMWGARTLVFGADAAFAAPAEPVIDGQAYEALGSTKVTLQAQITPNEAETTYFFEYGETTSYGSGIPALPEGIGAGTEPVSVPAAQVTGLKPSTTYHYRVVASNELGTVKGPDQTFTALPPVLIDSESVSNVLTDGATLEAQINPLGEDTHYYFQYGTSSCTANPAACVDVSAAPGSDIGSGEGDQHARFELKGLTPGSTYHYRVLASNALGNVEGDDKTFTTLAAATGASSEGCPNEQLRAEQSYGLELPDCRAYEMVSPIEKNGSDATDPGSDQSRAAVSGEAIVFTSRGSFAGPAGSQFYSQLLSRRGSGGWSTQAITPPYEAYNSAQYLSPYETMAFTPELSKGIASTLAPLAGEAPKGLFELYLADLASGSYQWVSSAPLPINEEFEPFLSDDNIPLFFPVGTSTDLSHVVFFVDEVGLYEWIDGEVIRVSVANNGQPMFGNAGGGGGPYYYVAATGDIWNAVSSDGSRVFFTSPVEGGAQAQLYVRERTERPQSPLASPESNATGTLTEGSNTVTEVTPLHGATGNLALTSGSTEVTLTEVISGEFATGQSISGPGIPVGTTITKVSGATITLSEQATESSVDYYISSAEPVSFAVGQKIAGTGIRRGTTIMAVAPGALTLSAPSAFSGSAVALSSGGECTVSTDACTVEVSASQRTIPDPNGPQEAKYWGASEDGSKVFFTSTAELTEDAYTGPADDAANLYEYDLESGKITDLTVDKADAEGAAVQGVMTISEDGSYVYFVADGDLERLSK